MAPEIDALTRRAVEIVERWSRRAVKTATALLLMVVGVIATTTVIGVLALRGDARLVFLALAFVFGAIGIGVSWVGRWRLGAALRDIPQLTAELHQLVESNLGARNAINAYVVSEGGGDDLIVAETSAVAHPTSRSERILNAGDRIITLRQVAIEGASKATTIASIVASAKSFPLLAFAAGVITSGFAMVGVMLLPILFLRWLW